MNLYFTCICGVQLCRFSFVYVAQPYAWIAHFCIVTKGKTLFFPRKTWLFSIFALWTSFMKIGLSQISTCILNEFYENWVKPDFYPKNSVPKCVFLLQTQERNGKLYGNWQLLYACTKKAIAVIIVGVTIVTVIQSCVLIPITWVKGSFAWGQNRTVPNL